VNRVQLISSDQLRLLVPMHEAIAAMRDAFMRVNGSDLDAPLRIGLKDGSTLAMMARGDSESGTIVKLVSIRPDNRERGLPNIHALGAWLDGSTGQPLFLIEGATLTCLRTGAATGAATDLLAAPSASVLAMIGAGGQAADQVRGVAAVRALEEVRIVSRTVERAAALAEILAVELAGVDVRAVGSVPEAVAGADIVCCATNATRPVLTADLLKGRVHVNAIGSYRPDMRELAPEVLSKASLIVVDEFAAALSEAGEIIDAVESGAILEGALLELGGLLHEPPAEVEGLTIFKSVGIAVQDWAIGHLLSQRVPAFEEDVAADLVGQG
jgi:ornithine cyclodeaminase